MRVAIVRGNRGCSGGRLPRSYARGHEVRILNRRSPQHRIDRTTGEGLDVALAGCDVALRREQRHVEARRGDARRGHPAAARLGGGRGREPPRRRVDPGCERVPLAYFPGEGEPEARGGAGTRAVEPGPRHPVPRVHRRVVRVGGPVAHAVGVAGAAAESLLRPRGHSPARTRDHRRTGCGRGTSACTQVASDQRAPGAAAARAIPGRIGRALRSGALAHRAARRPGHDRFASACLTPEGGIATRVSP